MENLKEKYPNGTLVVVDIYTDIENNDYYKMTGKVVGIECGWIVVQDPQGCCWHCKPNEIFVSCVN